MFGGNLEGQLTQIDKLDIKFFDPICREAALVCR